MKIIGLLLLWALLVGASGADGGCKRQLLPSLRWSECAGGTVWVIETRRAIQPFFSATKVPTLRARSQGSPRPALLVNGSYHDGNYAHPVVEGLLSLEGDVVGALKPGDLQLTHIISIDRAGRISSVRPADAGLPAELEPDQSHLQSGPLILDQGRISAAAIHRSINGKDAYKRTALGRTAAGETVIVIAKTPWTLEALGELLLGINDYRSRRLTLLNLDGGPSTAIHSTQSPRLSYGADKVTPVGFAVGW